MTRPNLLRLLQRYWTVVVVLVVVASAAVYVGRLRLSEIPDRAIGVSPPAPELGQPREKTIEYRVIGPRGSTARVSYLSPGNRVVEQSVTLPWTKSVKSREFTSSVGVLAQSSGSTVTCTVKVNGIERSKTTGEGPSAPVNCSVLVT